MTPFRFIASRLDRGVLRITLRRPPLNVLDLAATREIVAALSAAEGEASLRAVLLAAEGKAFCAGLDVADHLPERVKEALSAFHDVFRAIERLGVPTVARVQGAALGGGCEIASACDWVFATPEARFGLPEIQLGVFPPVAAALFPALIGPRAATELILTGRVVPAEEAASLGLATRVVAADRIDAEIETLLETLRARSAHAIRASRRTLRRLAGRDPARALDEAERAYHAELGTSRDALEGLQAFLEKRRAVWADR